MLIRGASIFDGEMLKEGLDVRIEGERIVRLGHQLQPLSGEEVVEAQGKVLSPGFVDVHIHGFGGRDTMQGKEAVLFMAENMTRHGVTGFVPTTMCATIQETHFAVSGVKAAMEEQTAGARVLGCHMEAPFLNPAKKGAQRLETILKPNMADFEAMTQGCQDVVRMITVAPEMEGAEAFIRAVKDKILVSVGHTMATCAQAIQAADWGATQITHLFNAMTPFEHREPGVPGAALSDGRFTVQVIADMIHLHPAAVKMAILAKGPAKVELLTDAMEATDMPDGEYELGGLPVYVKNGAARLVHGDNLAGSTLTMDKAVKNVITQLGIDPAWALRMATATPAQAIGQGDCMGKVAQGYLADLVLLDAGWTVERTIIGGKTVYCR